MIFNGHTHRRTPGTPRYPGAGQDPPDHPDRVYGNNVGQVVLTVDDTTGEVTTYV